jgi:chromosome partitioning protein
MVSEMVKIVSVINLKGGVAKTTTTIQLAECLVAEFDCRVLVIDLDPQTNASIALIGEERWEKVDDNEQTLFHLFNDKLESKSKFNLNQAIQQGTSNLNLPKLHLLASSIRFIDIQDRIEDIAKKTSYKIGPMEIIKTSLAGELKNYDYVLIDCPPNLGFITQNGIEISDYYFIPTIPDTLSTYGIPQIVRKINDFKKERSLAINCLGLLVTKYVSNSSAHSRGMRDLPARFARIFNELDIPESPVFDVHIPQANATSEAMDYEKQPKNLKEKYGRGVSGDRYLYEYVIDLTKEFIKRVG